MACNLTIGALLGQGMEALRAAGNPSASLDAELLLAESLSVSRTHLKTHPEEQAPADRAQRYSQLLQRRVRGEPMAYILGYRDFWTLRLAVNPSVLVPRPDTELLVERALALGTDGCADAKVVDLGTGSGAIALALASERPAWQITAVDSSPAALQTAIANAAALKLQRVRFLPSRWFEALSGERFDLVISNPPYVADADPALQDAALTHEPLAALASGPDGLRDIRQIVQAAAGHLSPDGWLLLEHGYDQGDAVRRELVVRGFGHVRSHRDLAGHERVTEAQWQAEQVRSTHS